MSLAGPMKRCHLVALALLLAVTLPAGAEGARRVGARVPHGVDADSVFTFYDSGSYRQASLSEIAGLVNDAASDPQARLGPEWHRSPGYAARYFTLDLVGIADWRHDPWFQTASGPGNVISDGTGAYLGTYLGLLSPDDVSKEATVTVKTGQKTAFRVSLARPWPGGPWLVVNVAPSEYVEGP